MHIGKNAMVAGTDESEIGFEDFVKPGTHKLPTTEGQKMTKSFNAVDQT
jgi:hypothetical protein